MTKDNMNDTDIESIASRVVSKMFKLKAMEDWFDHVNKSEKAWQVYEDLDFDPASAAYGELAKLMTLMDIAKNDEQYEKCAIIKDRIKQTKKIIKKYTR
jgi:hypothetical protein